MGNWGKNMNQSSERTPTPKELYDKQMDQIDDERLVAQGKDPDEEKELDAMTEDAERILDNMESKEIDKKMGDKKEPVGPFSSTVDKATGEQRIEVTREQFEKHKADQAAQKALLALKNAQYEHLKPEQKKEMNLLVAEFEVGKLDDPVLAHLMKEKIKLSQDHVRGQKEVNELQRKMLHEVARVTNNLVKTKGAMETTDKMILDRNKEIDVKAKET